MANKLTWQQIKQQYDGEWVELIDFEWDMTEPDPSSGVVRVHAKDRKEFHRLAMQDPPAESAVVYVGPILMAKENMVFNANQRQWFSQK